jgi:malate synthase
VNTAPAGFDPRTGLPEGFLDFYLPLHRAFAARQRDLRAERARVLARAHRGSLPGYLPPSEAVRGPWRIDLPSWCADQRNQMTGPADDAELVVKMLNSGAPGVMLDLEDSMANEWPNLLRGIGNILEALRGGLSYFDRKRSREVGVEPSSTVAFVRVRGLHLSQAGVLPEPTPAPLFDLAMVAHQVDPSRLRHPLSVYIPKSESAEEALWWRDVFRAVARGRGWPEGFIRCMALVESHPLAFQMEEFVHNLRDHILGLNLGRWDYMASLIHYNLEDPAWVLPDRNTIPHDVPFFQRLRELMSEVCHRRGILAIGGMTALYPSREDPELNARALAVLEKDKKNEADCLMDGAWTGHPDQNAVAVAQFPVPNQIGARRPGIPERPDLRPAPNGVGRATLAGTRAAVRTVIRYRSGVLAGKGASLLDGYMEDLATDRIYRLMIAQRVRHNGRGRIVDEEGRPVDHTPRLVSRLFDEEEGKILAALSAESGTAAGDRVREARRLSEEMIAGGRFDPA